MDDRVDVILTVNHQESLLKEQLKALDCEKEGIRRIIVVFGDRKPYPEEEELMRADPLVKPVIADTDFPGMQFNTGLQETEADEVLFLSEGAVPMRDDLISLLKRKLEEGRFAAVYGHPVSSPSASGMSRGMQGFMFQDDPFENGLEEVYHFGMKTFMLRNACALYKREAFSKAGVFENCCISHPEYLWQARAVYAGYRTAYVSDARVLCTMITTFRNAFSRSFDHGTLQSMYPQIFGLSVQMIYETEDGEHYPILVTRMGDIYRKQRNYALEYVRAHGEGFSAFSVQLVYLLKKLGYKFGNYYHRLPLKMIRAFSNSPNYWKS